VPKYQAISKTTHAHLRWKRFEHYHFAARDALAPLVVQELLRACMSMPIAFIEQNNQYIPAALQGLQPGQNLFVSPEGRWLGTYIPAAYRGYPFALANSESDQLVLCVDTDSGLVGEDYAERFFDDSGKPSQAVKDVLNFLQQVRANRELTERLCAALDAEGLIQPWPITLKGEDGERTMQGLYRIDEAKFNGLDPEALYRVHQAGALPLVYCQLLSMQHLQALGKLAEAHASAKAQLSSSSTDELDLEFLNRGGTISFGPH
jgi:hypothetical protein